MAGHDAEEPEGPDAAPAAAEEHDDGTYPTNALTSWYVSPSIPWATSSSTASAETVTAPMVSGLWSWIIRTPLGGTATV